MGQQILLKLNINSHYKELGPEIFKQLKGKVDAFVAGVGTGGTISGIGKYLKSKNKNCKIILADPKGSVLKDLINKGKASTKVGSWIVEGIGEDFEPPLLNTNYIDYAYSIGDFEAIQTCRNLLQKEGILAGSSSGTLIGAAIKYCRSQKVKKNVVTLVCDAGDKYLRKIYNESWRIKEGFNTKKRNNDLTDLVTHLDSSKLIPNININSNCLLAFKLMHENNLNYILVENDDKNIVGIVTDKSLIDAVTENSFNTSISNYIIKVKKLQYSADIKALLRAIKKEEYLLLYKNKKFIGIINRIDVLWYLKKNKDYA